MTHRVIEVLTGVRYSITLYTPGRLEHLTTKDWDSLARLGFPIYLDNLESLQMRRLEPSDPTAQSETAKQSGDRKQNDAQTHVALLSQMR